MKEAWTKNGASPFCSNHSTTDRRTKLVWESSTGKRAGAQVEPWASAPGKPSIGSYRSCGLAGTSNPCAGEPAPPRRAPLFPRVFDHGAESGQHTLVAEQPRVAGRHGARIDRGVRVPEQHRVVARLTSQERHVGEPGVQRRAVQNGAIAVLVGARVEAGPRRSARRRVGPVVCEQDAPAGQGIERGRLEDGMAEGRQAVPAPLVERDEEDVARRRHTATLADVDATPSPAGRPDGAATGPRPGSGRADRRSSELGPELDQPRTEAWCDGPVHCSATGHREAGGRTLHHPDLTRRHLAAHAHAAPLPMPSDPSGGRRPGIALPASGSSVHLACLTRSCITTPAQHQTNSRPMLTRIQEYSNIAVCLC